MMVTFVRTKLSGGVVCPALPGGRKISIQACAAKRRSVICKGGPWEARAPAQDRQRHRALRYVTPKHRLEGRHLEIYLARDSRRLLHKGRSFLEKLQEDVLLECQGESKG